MIKKALSVVLAIATPLSIALSLSNNASAYDSGNLRIEQGKGYTDWTEKVIKVVGSGAMPANVSQGQGRLLAERAAISDAYRQLAEVINGVKITSQTTVKDFVVESDVIKTSVEGFIKGARRGEKILNPDGTVDYELYVSLYGKQGLADAIDLDKYINKKQKKKMTLFKKFHRSFAFMYNPETKDSNINMNDCLQCHKPHPVPEKYKKKNESNQTQNFGNSISGITGVIIDARGLGIQPAMDPAVFDSNSSQIYIGNWEIDPDYVINYGINGYYSDIEDAKNDIARVGKNPLVIKASDVKGVTDPILEINDSSLLLQANNIGKFLEKYSVNIVI